jgi:hypothetical protein
MQLAGLPGAGKMGLAQAQQPYRPADEAVPVMGKAGPGLEPFDKGMRDVRQLVEGIDKTPDIDLFKEYP